MKTFFSHTKIFTIQIFDTDYSVRRLVTVRSSNKFVFLIFTPKASYHISHIMVVSFTNRHFFLYIKNSA